MRVRGRARPRRCSPRARRSCAGSPARPRLAVAGFVAGGRAALDGARARRLRRARRARRRRREARGSRARSGGAAEGRGGDSRERRARPTARCERITRRAAANFFYGIRLLPRDKRRAMCAVYAFARRVDDIGDGDPADGGSSPTLAAERARVEALRAGTRRRGDPVLVALGDARTPSTCRSTRSTDLIDGVERTSRHALRDLRRARRLLPPRRGLDRPAVPGDLRRRRRRARADRSPTTSGSRCSSPTSCATCARTRAAAASTSPAEDLRASAASADARSRPTTTPLSALIRFEAARARGVVRPRARLVPLLDARSASCVLAMTGIYRRILDRIERDPLEIARRRISLPPWEKALVAAAQRRGGWRVSAGRRRRVGGGLAGITAALDCADAARGHAARGPPAPGRRRLLVRARRPAARQRPARVPALLHRLPRAARAVGATGPCPPGPRSTSRCSRPGERRRLRRSVPAPLHLAGVARPLPALPLRERVAAARAMPALSASTPTIPPRTLRRSATG